MKNPLPYIYCGRRGPGPWRGAAIVAPRAPGYPSRRQPRSVADVREDLYFPEEDLFRVEAVVLGRHDGVDLGSRRALDLAAAFEQHEHDVASDAITLGEPALLDRVHVEDIERAAPAPAQRSERDVAAPASDRRVEVHERRPGRPEHLLIEMALVDLRPAAAEEYVGKSDNHDDHGQQRQPQWRQRSIHYNDHRWYRAIA